jgi:hypothetical protein
VCDKGWWLKVYKISISFFKAKTQLIVTEKLNAKLTSRREPVIGTWSKHLFCLTEANCDQRTCIDYSYAVNLLGLYTTYSILTFVHVCFFQKLSK